MIENEIKQRYNFWAMAGFDPITYNVIRNFSILEYMQMAEVMAMYKANHANS